jgi:hypothetical protein
LHNLRPGYGVRVWQAQEALWQQVLLPGVEEETVLQSPTNRTQPPTFSRRLRVRRAHLHLRKRPFRVDHGRSLLPKVRPSGTALLSRTLGARRVRAQATMHVLPDLQTILRLQALGQRLGRLFAHQSAYYMKFWALLLRAEVSLNQRECSKSFELPKEPVIFIL